MNEFRDLEQSRLFLQQAENRHWRSRSELTPRPHFARSFSIQKMSGFRIRWQYAGRPNRERDAVRLRAAVKRLMPTFTQSVHIGASGPEPLFVGRVGLQRGFLEAAIREVDVISMSRGPECGTYQPFASMAIYASFAFLYSF
ncbi:hypothetical protein [Labrenzia sp. OB1]|uniref:hypothetical protein n=1 Tax=Labrenzia sp. OB1 TaxID=1561204 RepID=UPI0012E7DC75|nr:hypothetical protein [Labrenzia sp. OB1]